MSILSGFKKYKDYIKTSSGYQLASRWTSSDTVEMSNGKTLTENTVELTQAEYDALDDSKLTDGVNYLITDGEGGGGGTSITLDTTLTVEGQAADAKAVGDRLTASDNTPFRFGVTEDGKYGYIVTDSEGADTVIPFSNKDELYEALQYSGLVTEDMTYEEMLEALSAKFPAKLNLYSGTANEANFKGVACTTWPWTPQKATVSVGEALSVTATSQGGGACAFSAASDIVDFTSWKKLKFTHTSSIPKYDGYNLIKIVIAESLPLINMTAVLSHQLVQVDGSNSVTGYPVELDVSSLSGEYYIVVEIYTNSAGTFKTAISDMYLE